MKTDKLPSQTLCLAHNIQVIILHSFVFLGNEKAGIYS